MTTPSGIRPTAGALYTRAYNWAANQIVININALLYGFNIGYRVYLEFPEDTNDPCSCSECINKDSQPL